MAPGVKNVPVLYENEFCIIFDKPAGLAVQGGQGVKVSLDSLLAETYSPRPLLVHRLDKDTSGLILVAKNRGASALFSQIFSSRLARKQYTALCSGRPEGGSGLIQLSLSIRGGEKQSETAYRYMNGNGEFSLLELELGTGRMHQIRRHLAEISCPVLGDDKYGDFTLNKGLKKTMGLRRLLLHASRLVIPASGLLPAVDVMCPLPPCFEPFTSLFPS
jgi:23S rRNA pseudouridine955/2504/2580 synthase